MGRSSVQAHGSHAPQIQIGWQNFYLVGRWTQIAVDCEIKVAGEYHVQIVAPDPDGHRVTFIGTSRQCAPGHQRLSALFKVGRLNPDIEMTVVSSAGETVKKWNSSDLAAYRPTPISPETRLIVTTGNPAGFGSDGDPKSRTARDATETADAGMSLKRVNIEVEKLPDSAAAYDGVFMLVIAGGSVVSPEQAHAVRDWVAGGGRLLISLATNLKTAKELMQPMSDWLPVNVGNDEITVRNFGKLEFFAGRNNRIPFAGRMSIPQIKMDQGEYLAGGREEAQLVRAPYGLGSVTVLALDLTEPPLSKWSEVNSLGRRLAESASDAAETTTARPTKSLQLSSTGVSDFATQIHASQEDFAGITRASPWFVMGLLGVVLLVIGPLDFLVVHRIFRSPRATWITFPIWIGLGTVLSANLAANWNGGQQRINQLNLVNIDVGSSTFHQKSWTNLYSPETTRKSVSVSSSLPISEKSSAPQVNSSWSGIPETSFGGMLRPSGLDVGRGDYRQTSNGPIEGLPFTQWSSKPLLTEIHGTIEKLIESDLQSNGAGRLTGTLIHRFPGPIEDWFLVHGNRVYRQMKRREDNQTLPLPAKQIWRVEQPNVFQRELRAYLTGEVAMSKQREGSTFTDVVKRHTDYDTLSRDPAVIFRTLTFYHQSGGRGYTNLTNDVLESEDLSHLVKLGRAVLFGRLDASTAVVQVDGQAVQPNRESTFVRIVLPVRKSGTDAPRTLEKLSD